MDPLTDPRDPEEFEIIQQTDKMTRYGWGCPRSHFRDDTPMWDIPSNMANLKRRLHAEGMARPDDPIFSWAPGLGVTRSAAAALLKSAAVDCGIPQSDVANHSLRSGAMTAALSAGYDYPSACRFFRWKSESVAELYCWPYTRMMHDSGGSLFSEVPLYRTRGRFVQRE